MYHLIITANILGSYYILWVFGNVPGQLALTKDFLENILKVILVTIFQGC